LAKADGRDLYTVNLFIGGCSLKTHYENLCSDAAAYMLEENGTRTDEMISIRAALLREKWDVVTLQQASHHSAHFETYAPYLPSLAACVRELCPQAKLYIHQTWGYEQDSERLRNQGYGSMAGMFCDVEKSYARAAEQIAADGVIPSGRALLTAYQNGIGRVHRDGFHAGLGAGRYILALTWYKTLTGADITNNAFDELDEPITDTQRKIAIDAALSAK
jgi:hypothetical protein